MKAVSAPIMSIPESPPKSLSSEETSRPPRNSSGPSVAPELLKLKLVDGADGDGERFSGRARNCGEPGQRGEESERPHAARRRLGCPRAGAAGFSSNSSASFSIITPASSSASTMVTARL